MKIAKKDIMLGTASMVIGAGVLTLPRLVANATESSDGWISIALAGMLAIALAWVATKLAARFPKMTFITYTGLIATKPVAIILTCLTFGYFFLFTAYVTRGIANIAKQYLFDDTPIEVIALIFILIVTYAVAGSRVGLLRLNILFIPIVLFIIGCLLSFSISLVDRENLKPFFVTNWAGIYQGARESFFSLLGFEAEEMEQQEEADKPKGKQRFLVTLQFVIQGALSGGGGGGGASAIELGILNEASFNISSVGDTMDSIMTELVTRTSHTPYFEHLQVVVISEDVARSELGFANVIDFFLRDQEMRRSIKVLVAKGEARKVLEVRPPNERLTVMYIRSITENSDKSTRMLPVSRLGDIDEHLLRSESFAIQRIEGHKNDVKIAGSAVFQGNKNNLIGFLDEEGTEGLNFITEEVKGGVIKIKVHDNLVVYHINSMKSRIKAVVNKKNEIQFTVTVKSEGTVGESFERLDFLKPNIQKGLEIKVEEEIERLMKDTITKVQKEYKKDVFGFGAYLRGSHYDTWKQVKEDWDSGGITSPKVTYK